jgi:hypothetical protein
MMGDSEVLPSTLSSEDMRPCGADRARLKPPGRWGAVARGGLLGLALVVGLGPAVVRGFCVPPRPLSHLQRLGEEGRGDCLRSWHDVTM